MPSSPQTSRTSRPRAHNGSETTITYWFYKEPPGYAVANFETFMSTYYPSVPVAELSDVLRNRYEEQFASLKATKESFKALPTMTAALDFWGTIANVKFVEAGSAESANIRLLAGTPFWS